MARKKKNPQPQKTLSLRWEFGSGIPTHDFLEQGSLDNGWNFQEAFGSFVYWIEEGRFLTWEAVVCEEQGLPLTAPQKKALGNLLSFHDGGHDAILYINEISRPSEPWYVILNKIVPHLLIEPFRTFDIHEEVQCDGWKEIISALEEHGQKLSLPPGVSSYKEVVPADLRHKLWLQSCFDAVSGLGQETYMTLEIPEEHYRIKEFIDNLRNHQDSVAYFGLTLDSLLTRVILPERDKPIFIKMMQDQLGLKSAQEPLAERLKSGE
ncbi:MAG: hypothetical protein K8U57_04515 [Planctomycetes bacterium]|nr:hypothetical protein [Planctomycetota bacterium]